MSISHYKGVKGINSNPVNLKSFTVIQTGTIRKLGYGFRFAVYSNYGRSCL